MIEVSDKMGNKLSMSEIKKKSVNRIVNVLLDFELMLLRWVSHIPFHNVRILFYRLSGLKIGRGSSVHMWCNFFNPKGIEIGEGTIIGDHAFLDGRALLKIGNHVDIASRVMIYNSEHNVHSDDFHAIEEPVIIKDYVFIGPGVIIQPGVTIGKGAVVAAGAVVAKDVNDFTMVGGVPAQKIGERQNKNPHYKLGRARLFQ
ncbi:acyltransferase [Candidatus Gottesmanbacteria bacterium]|nr:acyltransferase [Candidatus Gottesmanbacteria bacterium]